MKARRDRGSKDSVADECLNRLVVGIAQRRIDRAKTASEIRETEAQGNAVLDSAAKTRKTFKESKFGGKMKK